MNHNFLFSCLVSCIALDVLATFSIIKKYIEIDPFLAFILAWFLIDVIFLIILINSVDDRSKQQGFAFLFMTGQVMICATSGMFNQRDLEREKVVLYFLLFKCFVIYCLFFGLILISVMSLKGKRL